MKKILEKPYEQVKAASLRSAARRRVSQTVKRAARFRNPTFAEIQRARLFGRDLPYVRKALSACKRPPHWVPVSP
jgi:hypothetical protein